VDPIATCKLTRLEGTASEMAAGATYLHERLQGPALRGIAGLDAEDMVSRWDAALAGSLDRRLAWSGLDRDTAKLLLARGRIPSESSWMDVVAEVLTKAENPPRRPRYLNAAAPIAFEELLVPFVELGRAAIARDLAEGEAVLTDNAWLTLERMLLALLSRIALQTFCSEFALHQGLHGSTLWQSGSDTAGYRTFVSLALGGGLADIFCAYPVLARLLATTTLNWVRAHSALIVRLREDWPRIQRMFDLHGLECRVHSIAPYRSDLHDGGQSVVILELSGRLLVYKPRPLGMERAFGDILEWANSSGFSRPYRPTPLLACDGYGWMGYAVPLPCRSRAEIEAFYVRVGGLICLTALLQGTDIHYENVVASGDQPVLVDAETLFHPSRPAAKATDDESNASKERDDYARILADSGWFPPSNGPDFSALGAADSVVTAFPAAACIATNSDRMAFAYEPFHAPRRQNSPTLNGQMRLAASHRAPIIEGFREMFRLTIRARDSLLEVIRGFDDLPGRFVARSSNTYGLLLQASLAPDALRDGAGRGLLFERLRRAALSGDERPAHWSLLDSETEALERLDVPRIQSRDGVAALGWPSPSSQVVARLLRARECDLETRVRQLREQLARLTGPASDSASSVGSQQSETYQEACHGR